ncbi:hypothetical protein CEXT_174741 [Caerostris extrusa]|uniref:Uncharacterized protein n=1 Tax=Caerostris extrusa TaxID=172846 RepID=A0AAV4XD72_CAEEX|nr:hypothetical protein CEXT_174741 [Caerostris extrusa]
MISSRRHMEVNDSQKRVNNDPDPPRITLFLAKNSAFRDRLGTELKSHSLNDSPGTMEDRTHLLESFSISFETLKGRESNC